VKRYGFFGGNFDILLKNVIKCDQSVSTDRRINKFRLKLNILVKKHYKLRPKTEKFMLL